MVGSKEDCKRLERKHFSIHTEKTKQKAYFSWSKNYEKKRWHLQFQTQKESSSAVSWHRRIAHLQFPYTEG